MSISQNFDVWVSGLNNNIKKNLSKCEASKNCINYSNENNVKINNCFCDFCGIYQQAKPEINCSIQILLDTIIDNFSNFSHEQKRLIFPEWNEKMSSKDFEQLVSKELFSRCDTMQKAQNYISNTKIIIDKCGSPNNICDVCGLYQYCDIKSQCLYFAALNLVQEKIFKSNVKDKNIFLFVLLGITLIFGGAIFTYFILRQKRNYKRTA